MIQHRIGALEKVNHEFKMPAITPLKTQQIERKKNEKETVLGNYQGDIFFRSSPSEQRLPHSTTDSAMINESRTLPYLCSWIYRARGFQGQREADNTLKIDRHGVGPGHRTNGEMQLQELGNIFGCADSDQRF